MIPGLLYFCLLIASLLLCIASAASAVSLARRTRPFPKSVLLFAGATAGLAVPLLLPVGLLLGLSAPLSAGGGPWQPGFFILCMVLSSVLSTLEHSTRSPSGPMRKILWTEACGIAFGITHAVLSYLYFD